MKCLYPFIYLGCLLFSSCGYHFDGGEKIAISVPYVIGDEEGRLTDALASALAKTATFQYVKGGGDWTLLVVVKDTDHDRIGYRYDRDDKSGKLRDNVIGIENRETITIEVTVQNAKTGDIIIGPQILKGRADYDYVDEHSLQDLAFIDRDGEQETSIAFSLGQLDSVAAAGQDASDPVYRELAQRIVDGLIASGDICEP